MQITTDQSGTSDSSPLVSRTLNVAFQSFHAVFSDRSKKGFSDSFRKSTEYLQNYGGREFKIMMQIGILMSGEKTCTSKMVNRSTNKA